MTPREIQVANRYTLELEKVSDASYRVHSSWGVTAFVSYHETINGSGWRVIPQTASRTPSRKLWPTHLAALKSYFHRAVFVERAAEVNS